jgi:hypothetical protein
MHDSEQRGKLLLNGKKMSNKQLASALGLDEQKVSRIVSVLLDSGTASLDDHTGALMNRRMVRDEHIRGVRIAAGKQGGNPRLLNQNNLLKQKSTKDPPILYEKENDSGGMLETKGFKHGIPHNVAVVIAQGAALNPAVPEQACREFYAFYESIARHDENGFKFWVTSGENPSVITNWKAKLPAWRRDNANNRRSSNSGYKPQTNLNTGKTSQYRGVGKVGSVSNEGG